MPEDLHRYHRQMLLPGFGSAGQRRLQTARAVIVGCGALGGMAADLLARAGVGRLVIIDRDFVEATNLQRQVLFDEQDVRDALPKAEAARRRLARVNSEVEVTAIVDDLHAANIERHVADADVLVDGLDNFETRYLVNDYAVREGIPYLYGGAVGTSGLALAILPHTGDGTAPWERLAGGSRATPCLRCLFAEAPGPGESPTCDTAGVLGPVVGLIASFQAGEALKLLSGNLEQVSASLLSIDLWSNSLSHLAVAGAYQPGGCACCGQRRFEYLAGNRGSSATTLCGRDAVQLRHRQRREGVDLGGIADRLRAHGSVQVNEFMLRAALSDAGQPFELTLFADGRAIIKGSDDPAVARGVYAKYIGH